MSCRWCQLMVGARHIVQRKFIKTDGPEVAINGDEPDFMYGMEMMKHGSLDSLLNKMASRNLKLRDDELWMIFHCRELAFFTSCITSNMLNRVDSHKGLRSVKPPWNVGPRPRSHNRPSSLAR
jgi:hypothetical protein